MESCFLNDQKNESSVDITVLVRAAYRLKSKCCDKCYCYRNGLGSMCASWKKTQIFSFVLNGDVNCPILNAYWLLMCTERLKL